jgi:hypothetical protein
LRGRRSLLVTGLLLDGGSFSDAWSDCLQYELENLERIRILGSGSSKTNRVSSGEGNLTFLTKEGDF